jgi:hypothetical protein
MNINIKVKRHCKLSSYGFDNIVLLQKATYSIEEAVLFTSIMAVTT